MPGWEAFDVLKAILASLDKETRLPTSTAALHAAICDLAENPKYKCFLCEYRFSRALEIDFLALEMSGLLESIGLEEYALPDKLRTNFIARTARLFTEEEISTLRDMSREFREGLRRHVPTA